MPDKEERTRRAQSRRPEDTGAGESQAAEQAPEPYSETVAAAETQDVAGTETAETTEKEGEEMTIPGTVTFEDDVVASVAKSAAEQVEGVYSVGSPSVTRTVAEVLGAASSGTRGVEVAVGSVEAAFALELVVEHGHRIPDVAQQVRDNVGKQVEHVCGYTVKEVNIHIAAIQPPAASRIALQTEVR